MQGEDFLQVVCAQGEASSAVAWWCGCSPTPGCCVRGQVGGLAADQVGPWGCVEQAAALGGGGTAGPAGEHAGQRNTFHVLETLGEN